MNPPLNRFEGQQRKRVHRMAGVLENPFLNDRFASVALVEVIDSSGPSEAKITGDRTKPVRRRFAEHDANRDSKWNRHLERTVIGNRQKDQADRAGQEKDEEHDQVDQKCPRTEPVGHCPETELTAPRRPDVNLMDDRNNECGDEPDLCVKSKKMTLRKVGEIDKQHTTGDEDEQQKQMGDLPFEEEIALGRRWA